jgi:hypothetical protein
MRRDGNKDAYRRLEKDVSGVQFECIGTAEVGDKQTSLWRGLLPDQGPILVLCKNHKPGAPRHTRSFIDEEEARDFYRRSIGRQR